MVKLNFILKRLILLSLLLLLFSCGGGSSGGSAPLAQFPEQLAISEQINNIEWDISNLDSFCNNNQQCDPVVTDIQLLDSENSVIPTSTKDEIRTTFQTKLSILVEEIASSDVNLQLSNDEQISTFTDCITQMKEISSEFNVPEAHSILTQFQDTQMPVSSTIPPSNEPSNTNIDCHGIENGTGILDDCGVCDGPGISTWYQDSDGDELGESPKFYPTLYTT